MFRFLVSLRRRICNIVAFASWEVAGSESFAAGRCGLIGWYFRNCLCENPIAAATGDLLGTDLHKTSAFYWKKVSCGQDFYVDDGENPVIYVVRVYLLLDKLFADVMDVLMDCLVDHGCDC